jgi:hypothetical protein
VTKSDSPPPVNRKTEAFKSAGSGWVVREAQTTQLPKPVSVPRMGDALREVKGPLVK